MREKVVVIFGCGDDRSARRLVEKSNKNQNIVIGRVGLFMIARINVFGVGRKRRLDIDFLSKKVPIKGVLFGSARIGIV